MEGKFVLCLEFGDVDKSSSVGSGKSTLLRALLGELDISQGTITAPAVIAYCDQTPWLWDATIEENIIGAHEYDGAWLQKVLWSCGLDQDIQNTPTGSTIGEGGSSLSGGQRNRVSLARAVYSRIKLVVLDDVLSGLDSRTEMLVFSRVLGLQGLLKANDCTTVLATNSKRWTSYADSIILLEHGQKTIQGTPTGLGMTVSRLALDQDSSLSPTKSTLAGVIRPQLSDTQLDGPAYQPKADSEVYKQYFKSFGVYYSTIYFTLLVVAVAAVQMQSVWLKWWAAAEVNGYARLTMQVSVFAAISCVAIICLALLLGYSLLGLLVRSSLHLHARQW